MNVELLKTLTQSKQTNHKIKHCIGNSFFDIFLIISFFLSTTRNRRESRYQKLRKISFWKNSTDPTEILLPGLTLWNRNVIDSKSQWKEFAKSYRLFYPLHSVTVQYTTRHIFSDSLHLILPSPAYIIFPRLTIFQHYHLFSDPDISSPEACVFSPIHPYFHRPSMYFLRHVLFDPNF